MDEREIEKLLREAWRPQPPEGMRERVLERARQELRSRHRWFAVRRWEAAWALIGVLIVLGAGISDFARQARIAAIVHVSEQSALVAARPVTLGEWRREISRLMDSGSAGDPLPLHDRGDDSP